jgi:hypothetical protein
MGMRGGQTSVHSVIDGHGTGLVPDPLMYKHGRISLRNTRIVYPPLAHIFFKRDDGHITGDIGLEFYIDREELIISFSSVQA